MTKNITLFKNKMGWRLGLYLDFIYNKNSNSEILETTAVMSFIESLVYDMAWMMTMCNKNGLKIATIEITIMPTLEIIFSQEIVKNALRDFEKTMNITEILVSIGAQLETREILKEENGSNILNRFAQYVTKVDNINN